MRRDRYAPLYQTADYSFLAQLRNAEEQFELDWVTVGEQSPLNGSTMGGAAIRSKTGATVVGVLRQGQLVPNPDAQFVLAVGDVAGVIGKPSARAAFEALAAGDDESEVVRGP